VISSEPSYGLDAIYGVIALVLGINIYNEQLLITKQKEEGSGIEGASGSSSGSEGDK
jgi:hypothetical protein